MTENFESLKRTMGLQPPYSFQYYNADDIARLLAYTRSLEAFIATLETRYVDSLVDPLQEVKPS